MLAITLKMQKKRRCDMPCVALSSSKNSSSKNLAAVSDKVTIS